MPRDETHVSGRENFEHHRRFADIDGNGGAALVQKLASRALQRLPIT